MTNQTKLIILRVVVSKGFKSVYDQGYHTGLNVIRGENGVGKSTIMELIAYGLGADIKKNNWKKEALSCDQIVLAIRINKNNFVLRRHIENESNKPPIHIYEGTYEDSLRDSEGWSLYKYRKSEDRKSFSMQLFDLLGYEQHITEDNDSLTMHQIMRLLYVDQDTPSSKIFRMEPFVYDKESMRIAIGEFLFGFDDLEAHRIRQQLYGAEKQFDKLNDELQAIYRLLGKANITASLAPLETEISELSNRLIELDSERSNLRNKFIHSNTDESTKEAKRVSAEIESEAKIIGSMEELLISISYEIAESREFIDSLNLTEQAIKEAQLTVKHMGTVDFEYCPSCLSKIEAINESCCSLCKTKVDTNLVNESYIQALNELFFQKSESARVLENNIVEANKLQTSLKDHRQRINRLKLRFNELNEYSSDYENALFKISNEKGFIESQIEFLRDKLDLASELQNLVSNKAQLASDIVELKEQLERAFRILCQPEQLNIQHVI